MNKRGFSLVELLIVVVIIGILVFIAVPYLIESKRSAESVAAQSTLRNIAAAEVAYTAKTSPRSFAPLATLAQLNLIDNRFSSGTATFDGYVFSGESTTTFFTVYARPLVTGSQPTFYINHSYVIHYENHVPVR